MSDQDINKTEALNIRRSESGEESKSGYYGAACAMLIIRSTKQVAPNGALCGTGRFAVTNRPLRMELHVQWTWSGQQNRSPLTGLYVARAAPDGAARVC